MKVTKNEKVGKKKVVSEKRRAAIVRAVRKRRKKVREMALSYKGDKCQVCGYDRCKESLEFHHVAKDDKSFGISAKGYTRSWKAIKAELDKCVMLCANCHREWHAGLLNEASTKLFEILNNHSEVAQLVRAADCQLMAASAGNDGV